MSACVITIHQTSDVFETPSMFYANIQQGTLRIGDMLNNNSLEVGRVNCIVLKGNSLEAATAGYEVLLSVSTDLEYSQFCENGKLCVVEL
jgi:hypothetical protein